MSVYKDNQRMVTLTITKGLGYSLNDLEEEEMKTDDIEEIYDAIESKGWSVQELDWSLDEA